jgi:hypothetical protein
MPESTDERNIFLGEFVWSPAYIAHDTPYRGHDAWTRGHQPQRLIKEVCVTAEGYLKERVYDCSVEDSIQIQLPSKILAEGMSLRWSGDDGAFCDSGGREIALDPAAREVGPQTSGLPSPA